MPTSLTVNDASDALFPWSTTGEALTIENLDNVAGNQFAAANDILLIVRNPTAGDLSFQVTSQALSNTGRTGDIDQSLAAGEMRIFRLARNGWANTSDLVLIPSGLSASLEIAVVKLK